MADPSQSEAKKKTVTEQEKVYLRELSRRPFFSRIGGYISLSGPGWLQSAMTLGGGSLTGSLYLGVLAGFSMLWLQPLAMILGIIMLSAIGYITLSTGERPFRAINRHVSPILGWSWLAASMLANMVWALPQYSLATGVLRQNLLPDLLGADGPLSENQSKLLIVGCILLLSTIVTWSYGSGNWGVRLYERLLKVIVALIVLCFLGVVVKMALSSEGIEWGAFFGGFVPDFGSIFRPADGFVAFIEAITPEKQEYWRDLVIGKQRDVLMAAFATAVGINMTFMLPYSMLGRGWGREHRGLATFDLTTGMFIPFLVATSCVVIASANQFYAKPQPGLITAVGIEEDQASAKQRREFNGMLAGRLRSDVQRTNGTETQTWSPQKWTAAIDERKETAPATPAEMHLAATLVTRDAQQLSASLQPLLGGGFYANIVFGLGVLGMALSTITLLMLVSGFVVCEIFNVPTTGWPYRLGSLAAATGALGPFFWGKAAFWLAVPTSVFGLMLLPIAYLTFFLLLNQKSLLGDAMPRGGRRLLVNLVMGVATAIALFASGWAIWSKRGWLAAAWDAVF